MRSFAQVVDVQATVESDAGLPIPSELHVVEAEIERVFGGGGSIAEVDVVFDDLLQNEQKDQLEERVSPVPGFDLPDEVDFRGITFGSIPDRYEHDRMFYEESTREFLDITLTVDVAVSDAMDPSRSGSYRLFTGTVTKIEENHERIVTLTAMDRRFQLNRNSVFLDVGESGQPTTEIVRNVLTDMGWQEGEDFVIDISRTVDPDDYLPGVVPDIGEIGISNAVRIYDQTWGVDSHATAYEVLQDVARVQGATIHIDRENVVHFTHYPRHALWEPDPSQGDVAQQIPPIIEWESSSEEHETDVVVESDHDETGYGIYTVVGEDTLESVVETDQVSKKITENNIISREALENVTQFEIAHDDLLRDSGTMRVAGDPRIEPYDEFVVDDSLINAFAPISEGEYMSKTCRHTITGQEGYIVEVELGDDPKQLFDDFTNVSGTQIDPEEARSRADSEGGRFYSDRFPIVPIGTGP